MRKNKPNEDCVIANPEACGYDVDFVIGIPARTAAGTVM
jgi:hypothetical protein